MVRLSLLGACCAVSACTINPGDADETSDAGDGGTCIAPSGRYQLSYVEQSGNCGAQLSESLVLDGPKLPFTGCTGTDQTTSGGCRQTFRVDCQVVAGQVVSRSGTFDWSSDGKKATGSMDVAIQTVTYDAAGAVVALNPICSSRYAVTYLKE